MTQDEIIEMAREAGLPAKHPDWIKAYLAFEKLVAAKEREACAKVCDALAVHPEYASEVTKLAALAIRARAQADGGEA
jgi:hypothetical protein